MSRTQVRRGRWKPRERFRPTGKPVPRRHPDEAGLVRFVGERVDPDSGQREGLVQLSFRLRSDETLDSEVRARISSGIDEVLEDLAEPRRFSPFHDALPRGRAGYARRTPIAISWFRVSATERIDAVRRLAALLTEAGFPVEELRTTRPGYITYEDALQVVAVPFYEDD